MLHREVREVMSINPSTVTANQNLDEVVDRMLREDINQLPVVDESNHFLGMVTTYDLWKFSRKNGSTAGLTVGDIMNPHVIKITPKDKLGTAAELFMDKRFKTLPVVNLRNELKGVITAFDVIKNTLKDEYPRAILYKEVIEGQGQLAN